MTLAASKERLESYASAGPLFSALPSIDAQDANCPEMSELARRKTPVVVRGGAKALPAFSRWTFEALADRAAAAGGESGLQASAQVGTIEQGPTRSRQAASAADYLRGLAREEAALLGAGGADSGGLLLVPDSPEAAALARGESVPLRWEELRGGSDRLYLSQWPMLDHFPEKRADVAAAARWWPLGPRLTYLHSLCWCGPSGTVSGLHYDVPNNWFAQIRGAKEFVLFPSDQAPLLPLGDKYDVGSYDCAVDILRLETAPADVFALFRQARGWYVQLRPGDALFVPKGTFHAVVALTPSVSFSSFGHTPAELLLTGGVPLTVRDALHRAGLWRWGRCTCHGEGALRPLVGPACAGAALAALGAVAWRRWWGGQQ